MSLLAFLRRVFGRGVANKPPLSNVINMSGLEFWQKRDQISKKIKAQLKEEEKSACQRPTT